MDSDLSHDPSCLPGLLAAVDAGADLAIGSRYVHGGSTPNWPLHRRLLSRAGNRYSSRALRLDVRDATSGFRAYSTEILGRVDVASVRADGYAFQIEMTYRVAQADGHIVELPITFLDRGEGSSKMSMRIVAEALVLTTW